MKKKILALILTVVMVLALVPTAVFAEEVDTGSTTEDSSDPEKTLTVGESQTYTTVQQAINAIYAEVDPTGWTIEIETGTYVQFAIPKELDGLTVKAADGAAVTITTWTGEYDSALTATPNSTMSSNSYYNTQGYRYVFNSVYVQAEDVTFSGLAFTLGTAKSWQHWTGSYDNNGNKTYEYTTSVSQPASEDENQWEEDSSGWYRACITDLGGYSGGKTMSTGMTVTYCTFSSEKQGYVTTYPTGSTYSAYGILIGASTSWTVTDCTFDKFSSAICFMCDNYAVSTDGITVTNNTFTNCDRAMDGYYGGTPDETAGTLIFSDNTVTGTASLRSKIVVMDQASKGSIGKVSITDNTFSYTMVLMENMAESSCTVNDILKDNTFSNGSYYVEGDGWYYSGSYHGSITVNIPDAAYYEAPDDDTGYWVLNVNLDSLGSNTEGATEAVQAIIGAANAEGSHTLNITWADTDEETLLYTVTAFKDCIYWVSGTQKESEPGLDKVIVVTEEDEDGNEVETELDQDDVAAGDTVNFKLTSNVPSNLAEDGRIIYEDDETTEELDVKGTVATDASYTLTFHDVMDEALVLDTSTIKVEIYMYELNDSGAVTYPPTEKSDSPVDVTIYAAITTTGLSDGCTFEVTLDLLALYSAGIIDESDFGSAEVVVTYSATLSEGASAGAYYNTAWVVYPDGKSEEDKVEVDTYGIQVFKYDQEDGTTGLEGATFQLLQKVEDASDTEDETGTEAEADTETETTAETVTIGEDTYIVLGTYVSDSDGYAIIDGLDTGIYYLQEIEAPEGYVCSDSLITVEIPDQVTEPTYDADGNISNVGTAYYASVKFANAEIPSTGGAGTVIFTVVGAGIIAVAGVVLVVSRRKHEDEE